MDGFTLSLATAFISLVMALSLSLLWIANQQQRFLIDWSLAGGLFFLSNFLTLFTFNGFIAPWLAPVLVNLTYLCGHAAILAGIRRQLQQPAHWDYIGVLVLLIVFLHCTPFVQAEVGNRILVFYPLLIGINAMVVLQLLTAPKSDFSKAYWPILWAESLFMLQLIIRFALMIFDDGTLPVSANADWVMTSGTLAVLIFLLLVTIGCVLILMRSQELLLRQASHQDPLTQCQNRRALDEVAPREFLRAKRSSRRLAMLILDIDHFKAVNDRFGHRVGDQVLQKITEIAAKELRGYDQLFRLGGEEFVALLTDVDEHDTKVVAERLRSAVQDFVFTNECHNFQVSISVGIANLFQDDVDWQATLQRADRALYLAKAQGRNQVCVAANMALAEVVIT
jgi:diguanylate cyclase (GGDEF)-like protein